MVFSPYRQSNDSSISAVERIHGSLFNVNTSSYLEWYIFVFGGHETSLLHDMLEHIKAGDVAIDCGANIGLHSCPLARHVGPTGRLIAVEPIDEVADRLSANVALNGLANVTLVRKAASSSNGTAEIFPSREKSINRGQASLHPNQNVSPEGRAVDVVSIDRLVTELGLDRLDLVKIDVEGHELEVLRGARQAIERWRPILYFELLEENLSSAKVGSDELLAFVHALGYETRPVSDSMIKAMPRSAGAGVG